MVGVISLILYLNSLKEREILFTFLPGSTTIFKAEQLSRLNVQFDTIDVKNDINLIRIGIWNDGGLPAENKDILDSININLNTSELQSQILEAKIVEQTRLLSKIEITQLDRKNIKLNFHIMEKGDGAVLQIIYTGDLNNEWSVNGTIKGQGEIEFTEYKTGKKSDKFGSSFVAAMIIGMPIGIWLTNLRDKIKKRIYYSWLFNLPDNLIIFTGFFLGFGIAYILLNIIISSSSIPFN
jgi:hypothetical protein